MDQSWRPEFICILDGGYEVILRGECEFYSL